MYARKAGYRLRLSRKVDVLRLLIQIGIANSPSDSPGIVNDVRGSMQKSDAKQQGRLGDEIKGWLRDLRSPTFWSSVRMAILMVIRYPA